MAANALSKAHELEPFAYMIIIETNGVFSIACAGTASERIGLIETAKIKIRCELIGSFKAIEKTETDIKT